MFRDHLASTYRESLAKVMDTLLQPRPQSKHALTARVTQVAGAYTASNVDVRGESSTQGKAGLLQKLRAMATPEGAAEAQWVDLFFDERFL